MSHRHHCPVCHRPCHGLTSDEVFDTLTRRLTSARVALRAQPLRRLARRIGTCDCHVRLCMQPPAAKRLVREVAGEVRAEAHLHREAA